jgi:hypothetical protein
LFKKIQSGWAAADIQPPPTNKVDDYIQSTFALF